MRNAFKFLFTIAFILISASTIYAQDLQESPEQDLEKIKSDSLKNEMLVYASWTTMSEELKRLTIIARAKSYIGKYGGQCKFFVQKTVVEPISGILLPQNYSNSADPYHLARWHYSNEVEVIYQWLGNVSSISSMKLKPGYVVQWRMKDGTPHTFIVEAIGLYTIQAIDSNFVAPTTVGRHWMELNWINQNVAAGTVYRVK